MKVLFVYWHGLGDNILATPAIKKYKETTGNFVGWMMQRRFQSADLFGKYPYVDAVHWCSDAWSVAGPGNINIGSSVVMQEARKLAVTEGYDAVVPITHRTSNVHKIYRNALEMGVGLSTDELHTEFYYDEDEAEEFAQSLSLPKKFIFFHGNTGLPAKNMPIIILDNFNKERLPVVSPDWTWDISSTPIGYAAHIMRKASNRLLVDSSLYHIANALDLSVDIAYFARGEGVWNVVKPLHKNDRNIVVTPGSQ